MPIYPIDLRKFDACTVGCPTRLNSAIFVFNDHLLQPSAPCVHKQERRIRGYRLRSLLSTLLERRTRRALQHSSSRLFIHAKSGLRSEFGFTSWIWLLERQFGLDPGRYILTEIARKVTRYRKRVTVSSFKITLKVGRSIPLIR
jgi:hypothetical protein